MQRCYSFGYSIHMGGKLQRCYSFSKFINLLSDELYMKPTSLFDYTSKPTV